MYFSIVVIAALAAVLIVTLYELLKNTRIKKLPARPAAKDRSDGFDKIMNANLHDVLYKVENNIAIEEMDYNSIADACEYLDYRFDCADFRMQTMIRLLYKHQDKLPKKYIALMKTSLLKSKFFMDQPGEDSMCLWSENHLLLFAAAEYLTGQLYESEIFSNDGLDGKTHKAIAAERINIWLKQRFKYGFIEWYSNTYYEEDIAPIANIIDFCDDADIVVRAKMALDLLLFDIAAQSHKGSFTSTSGRQYELGKKSGENSALNNVIKHVWGYKVNRDKNGMDLNFIYMDNYQVPSVIQEIGRIQASVVIKASIGLDVKELVKIMPKGQSLERVMMQWAMEAFTNSDVITDTIRYLHKNRMLSNEFLHDFKAINLSVLKAFGLLPLINKIIRPFSDGAAIQRANTYTYKTKDYMLATAQAYHPGEFGDQQHIWSATLAPNLCVFTTHPAPPFAPDGALSASPNIWVGNGRNPHSVQDKNVNLTIYYIDGKKGFMEKTLSMHTHCYFPQALLDETDIRDTAAFGRVNNTYIAVLAGSTLVVEPEELTQHGALTFWATELGSGDDETFDAFKARVLKNQLKFDRTNKSIAYETLNQSYKLTYRGDFLINREPEPLEYQRFDSAFSKTKRESDVIRIENNGHTLTLDFEKGLREIT